jgi:hypothetical protein
MNKYTIKKKAGVIIISLLLCITVLLTIPAPIAEVDVDDMTITMWGKTEIINGAPASRPDLAQLHNGSFVLVYNDANGAGNIFISFSHDEGETWTTPINTDLDGDTPKVGVTDNDTIIVTGSLSYPTEDEAEWTFSFDYGATWSAGAVIDLGYVGHVHFIKTVENGTVWMGGSPWGGGHGSGIYRWDETNCEFELYHRFVTAADAGTDVIQDEFDIMMYNATHWQAFARCDALVSSYIQNSTDGGVTWDTPWNTSVNPFVQRLAYPRCNWLNEAEGVAMFSYRNASEWVPGTPDPPIHYYIEYKITTDFGVTFSEPFLIETSIAIPPGGYSGCTDAIELEDKVYMVWFSDIPTGGIANMDIYGAWITDNTSYFGLVSVNDETNGSTVTEISVFNWSKPPGAEVIRYQLQIATDTLFTSLVVNLSDINETTYGALYDESASYVEFILPVDERIASGGTYYIRIRYFR